MWDTDEIPNCRDAVLATQGAQCLPSSAQGSEAAQWDEAVLAQIFELVDTNQNGLITRPELIRAIRVPCSIVCSMIQSDVGSLHTALLWCVA